MTLYESPQVQEWRIKYAELREVFGTELSEFEFIAQKASELTADRIEALRSPPAGYHRGMMLNTIVD